MRGRPLPMLVTLLMLGAVMMAAAPPAAAAVRAPQRPEGPCDIYAAAGDPCVAAYSTTRAMYASYDGPLYRIERQSDRGFLDVGVVPPTAAPVADPGGYADAAAQDAFCANTYCWITRLYDQSPRRNDLTQAPRGGWSGPALGGMDNVPLAGMAPVMVMGHEVYGIFIEPGMGLRDDDPTGTAVDDQAEGEYWVVDGRHFNSGCCFDFGNAEIDSRDDDAGTMETAYFGDAPWWYHGNPPGPWVMTDQENNLVGCVNPDGSRLCARLADVRWRFVTGMAQGEPHRWTSLGGDAQGGALAVMFSGPRVDWRYDPMRKQGGIVLGNGGDNSNGSQGTFYEGAITAAGTFPTGATDRRVAANIAAARYRRLPLGVAPAAAVAAPPGLQVFSPGSSQDTTVTFTNTTGAPAENVRLSIALPGPQWRSAVSGSARRSVTFAGPLAPHASVSATFRITPQPTALDGDLTAEARWTGAAGGGEQVATRVEKVRSVPPVRINELRIGTRSPGNPTNSFIELYNAGAHRIDISRWTLTEHPAQQAISSAVTLPSGTKLAAHAFYLLGLADSGLAVPAQAGDRVLYVRSTDGMKAGDTVRIGTGPQAEVRKIIRVGTAAGIHTTLWQPLPDGPIITIPPGSTHVPVQDVSGFAVGQKVALGYGSRSPAVARGRERYEVATVTAVGKPGTQAYLATPARAGATDIKVTAVRDISVGDRIRLDIDSVGHGIETVTVRKVGTAARITRLLQATSTGATHVELRDTNGFAAGDRMIVGVPAYRQTVTVTSVRAPGPMGGRVDFMPGLRRPYPTGAAAVDPGTGLELAAPLRFDHAANLPFSDRGTGIRFEPATAFIHASNDPIRPLGTGIEIGSALAESHPIDAPVRDAAVTTAGYQGAPAPDQWFGGPELTAKYLLFGRRVTAREGSMVLRDAAGRVVDSLDYGGLADPWAAEGYQGASGLGAQGCYVPAPASGAGEGVSAGRFPDGFDSGSNCTDFVTAPATPGAPNRAYASAPVKSPSGGTSAAHSAALDESIFGSRAARGDEAAPLPFVSAIFGDDMVLQRGKPDTIWGWSRPGDSIRVRIAGERAAGRAGSDGRWQVRITPPPPGGPYTLRIADARQSVELHDVMVGDVWICGGQSNMELPLRFTDDAARAARQAKYPDIRYFTVAEHTAYRPTYSLRGKWEVVSPETAGRLSAVAFYFGRKLERQMHVPIGLVVDAVGGSAGESWAGAAALRPLGDYDIPLADLARLEAEGEPAYGNYVMPWYDEYDIGLKRQWYSPAHRASGWKPVRLPGGFAGLGVPVTPAVAWFRKEVTLPDPLPAGDALLSLGEIQRMDSVYVNGTLIGGSAWVEHPRAYRIPPGLLRPGRNLIAIRIFKTKPHGGFLDGPSAFHLVLGDHTVMPLAGVWRGRVSVDARPPHPMPLHFANWPVMPAVLYNGMVVPLAPLSLTGAVWYQGEQNSPRGYEYRKLLPAVIASWRRLFGQGNFPFYIVQLPGFGPRSAVPTDDGWADIRESQAIVAASVAHSCLAVSDDTGDAASLHPGNKKPVGDRLARCALARHYGRPVADSGPTPASIERRAHSIRLRFAHANGGLVAAAGGLRDFSIAGRDRRWHWARARILGNAVIVSSPQVPHPTQVRYDWQSDPRATLFNGAGLPAGPFRTDTWPLVTQDRRPY
jgi:hypothetical protein